VFLFKYVAEWFTEVDIFSCKTLSYHRHVTSCFRQQKVGVFWLIARYNDKKSGYGSTTYPDDRPEQQGKYRDNVLIADVAKDSRNLFKLRLSKLQDRINYAVVQAEKAAETAALKADVADARFHQHSVTSSVLELLFYCIISEHNHINVIIYSYNSALLNNIWIRHAGKAR